MVHAESSYTKLSKLLKKIKKEKEEVRISTFIEQIAAELNLKVAAMYRVQNGNLVVEKSSGTVFKDMIVFGYGPCGIAAEQNKSVLNGTRLAIPIMGSIILKQVFYAEGEFDEEDLTQIEGLLKSFEDVNYKELLQPNPIKKEELYKRMCTIIQFFYGTRNGRWDSLKKYPFQYFVQASCISCLARKSSKKGHTFTVDMEGLRSMIKVLFPDRVKGQSNPKWFPFECKIDRYGYPIISLPLPGCSAYPIHSILTIKELEDMMPTLWEWFPDKGTMGEYLQKKQVLRDILITSLESRAKKVLGPQGIEISVYLRYFMPDACKDNVCVIMMYAPNKMIEVNTSEDDFDTFLQDAPQIIEYAKSREAEKVYNFSGNFKNYPINANLETGRLISHWFCIHVTLTESMYL